MRNDLARLTSAQPAARPQPARTAPATRPRTDPTPPANSVSTPAAATAAATDSAPASRTASNPAAISLAGKSEQELRAILGAPTSEEDRPPGKRWHYRDGHCALDVQLYPDVKTKQFGTLAYEVRSDDNTDEGKRVCLAQLQSRAQPRD